MRINPDPSAQPLAESGRSSTPSARAEPSAASSPGELGEDQAQLSGAHTQIAVLAAQVLQLPEVRQERVQALRQALEAGSYAPSSQDVAGAMLNYGTRERAA